MAGTHCRPSCLKHATGYCRNSAKASFQPVHTYFNIVTSITYTGFISPQQPESAQMQQPAACQVTPPQTVDKEAGYFAKAKGASYFAEAKGAGYFAKAKGAGYFAKVKGAVYFAKAKGAGYVAKDRDKI
ncbi:hypothetical protein EMCRGX_G005943 [Ephydatia muelleri]